MEFIFSGLLKYPSEEPLSPCFLFSCFLFPAYLPQSKTNNPPSHRMGIPSGKPDLPLLSRLHHPFPVPVKFTHFLYPVYQPRFFFPSADLGRFSYSPTISVEIWLSVLIYPINQCIYRLHYNLLLSLFQMPDTAHQTADRVLPIG